MSYELSPSTGEGARKLLKAELAGRRWQDRFQGTLLPQNTVWIKRPAVDSDTTDTLHTLCARELVDAADAVSKRGLTISIARAWIFVSGAGTYGPAPYTLIAPAK